MPLESTIIWSVRSADVSATSRVRLVSSSSIDNSDFMRDGDFIPTRMQAQQDAVSLIFHAKTRSNPENNVGLLTLSEYERAQRLVGAPWMRRPSSAPFFIVVAAW
jgi:hypothetical protein